MNSKLEVNQIAPNFNVKDVMGKRVSLSNYKDGYLLLSFLRYSGCPWCNLAVHRLTMEYKSLRKNGCEVIAFIQSDKSHIKENIFKRHKLKPLFPIIADPERKIYDDYGIKTSIKAVFKSIGEVPYWVHAVKEYGFKQEQVDGNLFLVPGWFLIDARNKKIIKSEYGSSFYDHETFLKIYESLTFQDS